MEHVPQVQEIIDTIGDKRREQIREMLAMFTKAGLAEWAEDHTAEYLVGGQPYRMIAERGEDEDSLLVIGGEFGNGTDAIGAVARAMVIRKAVNPYASMILQPNTTLSRVNMNFTPTERTALRAGKVKPLTDRIRNTMVWLGDPPYVTAHGPSQGGVAVLGLAARPDAPRMGVAVVETPNVLDRSTARLMYDFAGSGGDLKQNITGNFDEKGGLDNDLIADPSLTGLAKYGLGTAKSDNRALLGIMRRASAFTYMEHALQAGGTVIHAWAEGDAVSPASANAAIADRMLAEGHIRYVPHALPGDHSITSNYLLNAALVNQARQ